MMSDNNQAIVLRWHQKAQIDYRDLYLNIYISYNAWYRRVTHTDFDREAIARLKKRFGIWAQYVQGVTLQELRPIVREISQLTMVTPLDVGKGKWSGRVNDEIDWHNLIEFWYQVRCNLFHGNDNDTLVVELAYKSLNCFMSEIINRMNSCFTDQDFIRLKELELLKKTDIKSQLYIKQLQLKFINSPDLWNVDMQISTNR